jgi:hypothetical protein
MASTAAEQIDWTASKEKAATVDEAEIDALLEQADDSRKGFEKVAGYQVKSRKEQAKATAAAFEVLQGTVSRPEIVWKIVERNGDKLTERTLRSPFLPAVRAVYPAMDRRDQSDLAQICNHALANEWSADELGKALEEIGKVELLKRERQRQRLRAGDPAGSNDEETVAKYLEQATASPLSDVRPPKEVPELGVALIIVGIVDGQVVVYDIDDDAKRMIAAVKSCAKRGRELRVRSAAGSVTEAAE